MSERLTFALWNAQQGFEQLNKAWHHAKAHLIAGRRMTLELREEKRSNAQNRRLWAMLADISQQVDWYGKKLAPEDWKHVFTASLKKLDVVPNLDGTGFVALGMHTSRMTKAEMSDMQTLMEAFGAEKGVQFRAAEECA